jgi:hypothetical protein
MENNQVLELAAVTHPDPRVRRVGFDLSHPYVEQVWGAVIGPSGVALLRRLPVLWREAAPARIPGVELARMLGLGIPTGSTKRLERALDRVVMFQLARWAEPGRALEVYAEVPPARGRLLTRLPEWSRQAHDRLLGAHIDGLARSGTGELGVSAITARFDRLQRADAASLGPVPSIGR